jgi:DNA (cytosine-5)-methyltransferase 1
VSADPPIAVIDIFAGPGGLGEGFAAYRTAAGVHPFRVRLSIEMDEHAHRTLLLRSFYRQFEPGRVPSAYYEYLRGEERWSGKPCRALLEAFPEQGRRAEAEAWREELRPAVAEEVDRRIVAVLGPRRRRPPWVLVGGPPCQAYSLAGRVRMLGRDPEAFSRDKRHTLDREYLRRRAVHAPAVVIVGNAGGRRWTSGVRARVRIRARGRSGRRESPTLIEIVRIPHAAHVAAGPDRPVPVRTERWE